MGMLHVHGMVPISTGGTGLSATIGVPHRLNGLAAESLRALGIALLVLTIIFAVGAIRGMLPSRTELRARRELDALHGPASQGAGSP